MFLLPGGHVQVDTLHPRVSHLPRTPVAVVGASRLGLGPHILLHLLQHRHQLLLVVALLRHLGGHDHLRCSIWTSAAAFFSSAFCRASASNSAFAARIFASRLSRRANSAGNSSPAWSFPYCSSSAASTASARRNSASTSACSFFSASLIRS